MTWARVTVGECVSGVSEVDVLRALRSSDGVFPTATLKGEVPGRPECVFRRTHPAYPVTTPSRPLHGLDSGAGRRGAPVVQCVLPGDVWGLDGSLTLHPGQYRAVGKGLVSVVPLTRYLGAPGGSDLNSTPLLGESPQISIKTGCRV